MKLVLLSAAALASMPIVASADPSNATFAYSNYANISTTLTINGSTSVSATQRGWIDQTGANNGGGAAGNFIAGVCGSSDSCFGTDLTYHNYFTFDLTGLGPITSATLNLDQPSNGFISNAASLTYRLYDFLGGSANSASGVSAFDDLGSGSTFGFANVGAGSNGKTVSLNFNAAGLSALNSSRGEFSFGGAVGSAVPEPATWALVILGFGAIGGAMRRRQSVAAKVRLA